MQRPALSAGKVTGLLLQSNMETEQMCGLVCCTLIKLGTSALSSSLCNEEVLSEE